MHTALGQQSVEHQHRDIGKSIMPFRFANYSTIFLPADLEAKLTPAGSYVRTLIRWGPLCEGPHINRSLSHAELLPGLL